MPIAYLTRVVEFTATHELPGMSAHSHRYQCCVTVRGPLAADTGGVVNLKALDGLLAREVVTRFDGRNLNQEVRLPTGEAVAVYIWERLAGQLPAGVTLHRVRVQEGPHLYSEYGGEA